MGLSNYYTANMLLKATRQGWKTCKCKFEFFRVLRGITQTETNLPTVRLLSKTTIMLSLYYPTYAHI